MTNEEAKTARADRRADAPLADVVMIFDLDGTLIDTAGDLAASMNSALLRAGLDPVAPEKVRHLVGFGARAMLRRGFEISGAAEPSERDLDRHLERFLDHYMAHIADHSAPFPGALDAIDRLKAAGAAIAICTNKRETPAKRLIEALKLKDYFATIVGSDTAAAAKPDPRPARLCLKRTKRRFGVFIGDSDTDIKTAAAAGMPCLAALFGYGPLADREEAFAAFDNYADLPDLALRAAAETIKAETIKNAPTNRPMRHERESK